MLALSCGFYETQIKWKEIQKIHVFVTKKKVPLTSYNTFYFLIDISWCIFTCAILKHVALNIISKNYHFPIPIALKKKQKKTYCSSEVWLAWFRRSHFYCNCHKPLSSKTLYSFEILLALFVFWQSPRYFESPLTIFQAPNTKAAKNEWTYWIGINKLNAIIFYFMQQRYVWKCNFNDSSLQYFWDKHCII